jgi:hypothetical protein
MARENKTDGVISERKARSGRGSLDFLSIKADNVDAQTFRQHIIYLIFASLLTKSIILIATPTFFNSFIDLFDISFYLKHGIMLTQGQIPYINYFFDYPILVFVPILISLVPALMFQNAMVFVYSFQVLMIACDIVTTICVYLITLKLSDKKTALYAGLLYATAFSAAYFVLTKYDAFPTSLFMVALVFTIYGQQMKGYVATAAGFFAKIFPVIALPFIVLYNAKDCSIKEEILNVFKVFIPLTAVLILPLLIFRQDIINTYLPIRTGMDYYSNTVTFTIYSWLHNVFGLGVTIDTILTIMFACMGVGLLALVYTAYAYPTKDPRLLLKLVLCSIVLVIFCVKVRSPQYLVWFTPLLCILAVDDIRKIIMVYIVQALAFIEFPLMFGKFYTSIQYTDTTLSSGWFITLFAFTLEYLALFVCLYFLVNPREIVRDLRNGCKKPVS